MLVYDSEIIRAITPADGVLEPGIDYAASWSDFGRLGISVVCAYDLEESRYRVFLEDNFAELTELMARRGRVAGFNNRVFDDRLLQTNKLWPEGIESYDLLREIWRGVGADPDAPFTRATHGGLGLEAMSVANGLGRKTGRGDIAAILWQRGRRGAVIDYCLNDVRLTLQLLAIVQKRGYLYNPRQTGDRIWVQRPLPEVEGRILSRLVV